MIQEAAHPPREKCIGCGGDGSQEDPCTCPGWIAVEDIAFADLKGLLAGSGLSITKGAMNAIPEVAVEANDGPDVTP